MSWTIWAGIGAIFAALSVGIGAFGAHGLKKSISPEMMSVFETGVQYHMFHALGILAVAAMMTRMDSSALRVAGLCFCIGILFFSGSLYGLALSGPRWLGPITPLGGVAFIVGWCSFAYGMFRAL